MPTVLRVGPLRFFFYAGDGAEPPHIHVERDDSEAKFWLDPVRLERSRSFRRKDISQIRGLVEEHQEQLLESWRFLVRGGFLTVQPTRLNWGPRGIGEEMMSFSTVEPQEALATRVEVSEDTLSVDLADGRTIGCTARLVSSPGACHGGGAGLLAADRWRARCALAGDRRGHQRREPAGWPAVDGKPKLFKEWLANRAKPES